jgi:hypothetical protein
LRAGEPVYFDLKRDEKRAFRLDVPQGGLMRVETLGRLKTSASVGTSFLPKLDEADDNGPGHNALLQIYLRAGAYRVAVAASESAGRLGLIARPAKLTETAPLAPDGAVRAMLATARARRFRSRSRRAETIASTSTRSATNRWRGSRTPTAGR